jgi:hypothetical protein
VESWQLAITVAVTVSGAVDLPANAGLVEAADITVSKKKINGNK